MPTLKDEENEPIETDFEGRRSVSVDDEAEVSGRPEHHAEQQKHQDQEELVNVPHGGGGEEFNYKGFIVEKKTRLGQCRSVNGDSFTPPRICNPKVDAVKMRRVCAIPNEPFIPYNFILRLK